MKTTIKLYKGDKGDYPNRTEEKDYVVVHPSKEIQEEFINKFWSAETGIKSTNELFNEMGWFVHSLERELDI